jgi:hypothetical protein
MLLRHLALAEEHIRTGERNIARVKNTIPELEVHDVTNLPAARQTLADFEHTQELFLIGFQQIKEELDKDGPT